MFDMYSSRRSPPTIFIRRGEGGGGDSVPLPIETSLRGSELAV